MNRLKDFAVKGDRKIRLEDFATAPDEGISKDKILKKMQMNLERIEQLQDKLYSEGKEGLVLIFQAMDAAGKDSTIKYVMRGLNPQGIDVHSFKQPSGEESSHSFLWRAIKRFPARGKIAIFNRSYYEDVIVVRVHKLYENANVPDRCKRGDVIERRFEDIRNFENYEYNNGYRIIKFFLNVSKDEQKKRFLERIDLKIKNWKFSASDVKERAFWDEYMEAYEDAINATSAKHSPWYVIPADKKWYARYLVSEAVAETLVKMAPQYPELGDDARKRLQRDREILINEDKLNVKPVKK